MATGEAEIGAIAEHPQAGIIAMLGLEFLQAAVCRAIVADDDLQWQGVGQNGGHSLTQQVAGIVFDDQDTQNRRWRLLRC